MKWNESGLVAAIVQHAETGAVLMLGWMNAESYERTRTSRDVWFWSRSRNALWKKGETSGNTLRVVEIRQDCDADALLIAAIPAGPTCHEGTSSCFSRVVGGERDDGPRAGVALAGLAGTLAERRNADPKASYTAALLKGGAAAINAKITEETEELTAALEGESDGRVVSEAADVIYHMLVGLTRREIGIADVWAELERRSGTSGHIEKASRPTKTANE